MTLVSLVSHSGASVRRLYYLKDEGGFFLSLFLNSAITACTPEGFLAPALRGSDFHLAKYLQSRDREDLLQRLQAPFLRSARCLQFGCREMPRRILQSANSFGLGGPSWATVRRIVFKLVCWKKGH